MSYEPRSRGMRFRRPTLRKRPSKDSRGTEANQFVYKENIPVDPQEVSSHIMNALEHLGNQRFGMPPFAEHFQRWLIDVQSALTDLQNSLPDLADENFSKSVTALVSSIQTEFNTRVEAERTFSAKLAELQRQLSANEREIAELESEQRTKIHEAQRDSEKSMKKIRSEIETLDAQRLKMIRHKPTILERIFGGAKGRIEGTSHSLQSRREDLQSREVELKRRLTILRSDYEKERKPLTARQTELKEELAQLQATTLDDALEIRKMTCDKLRQAVSIALSQHPAPNDQEKSPMKENSFDSESPLE
jgi:hypothetical protein